jgi:hypothetical protein
VLLGPAVSIEQVVEATCREKADLVGVSYRLTLEMGERLLVQFSEEAADPHEAGVRFAFRGTPPVAERAPFTAILIVFEMTNDYHMILLLLNGCIENPSTP